jgi:TRAP-type uncharacterized transport system substrate-binding protein
MKTKWSLRTKRSLPWLYMTIVTLSLIAIAVRIMNWEPTAPAVIIMATGAKGGSFQVYAERYKEILGLSGVEVRLLPTDGSVENLKLLNDPRSGVNVGFIQGGLTNEKLSPELISLGTVFYEPLWLFYRGRDPGLHLEGLRGRKISVGAEGSGGRDVVLQILARNEIGPGSADFLPLAPAESAEKLLRGEISAAFMLVSWDSPIVQRLLADPKIEIANWPRANTLVALYPYLNKLVLPAGVRNMAADLPPVDTTLLATKASLIVRRGLSSAIQYLLIDAATQVHSGAGVFQKSNEFPAPEQVDLPLSREAKHFYKSGPPFLQRYLPFKVAELVVRIAMLIIPIVGIAYPLLRLAPAMYGWVMRQRIYHMYHDVKAIEEELKEDPDRKKELISRLDQLEDRATSMYMSTGYAHLMYDLRAHINLVRERLGLHI